MKPELKPELKPFKHIIEKVFESEGVFEIPLIKKELIKKKKVEYTTYSFRDRLIVKTGG
tara:strand:+ start:764 stop:940 length:177 start_codon:yes stop_codon:yes gene_type:complete